MDRPLIFIGAPVYGDVSSDVLEDWMRFAYHLGRRVPEYDFYLGIKAKSEQFRARNAIVEGALQIGATWLLMLDDDMIIDTFDTTLPTKAYDIVKRLIAHDKDIVGALYYQRTGECAPVAMMKSGHGYRFLQPHEISKGLQEVDVVGGGAMLVRMSVFDRVRPPYFEPEHQWGTDVQLCRRAKEAGLKVWLDPTIELGHVRNERVIVTSRNRQQFIADIVPGEARQELVLSDIYNRLLADALEYTRIPSREELYRLSSDFLKYRGDFKGTDADWYRQFPVERVARQVWFNTENLNKRRMTEFIISSVNHQRCNEVLDFGCGIGIPAFTLAEKGHDVDAVDVGGTGTFEFLQWRMRQSGTLLDAIPVDEWNPPTDAYDIIVAMDCLEHIREWRQTLSRLVVYLKPDGVLFCNNGVLDDNTHPEHYPLAGADFIKACADEGLIPINPITFIKRAA